MLLRDVQVAESERAQQPLVADGDHEVGSERRDVERHRSHRLARVDDEPRVELVRTRGDLVELDQCAVSPVDVRHADDGRPLVEALEDRLRPAPGGIPGDGDQLRAGLVRKLSPGVDAGGVLLGEDHDSLAGLDVQVASGHREPVRRRGNQRDAFAISSEDSPEQQPQPLDVGEPVGRLDRPRSPALVERLVAGPAHRVQVWRQVGDVEVGDVVRHVEEFATLRNQLRARVLRSGSLAKSTAESCTQCRTREGGTPEMQGTAADGTAGTDAGRTTTTGSRSRPTSLCRASTFDPRVSPGVQWLVSA